MNASTSTTRTAPPAPPLRLALDMQIVPIALMVAAAALLLGLTRPNFLDWSNIYGMLLDASVQTLAISGFVYVLALGEIDLSAGAVYGLTGVLTGFLMQMDLSFGAAAAAALACAALIGVANGALLVGFGLNSLMLTIGTMVLVRGVGGVLNTVMVGQSFSAAFRALARVTFGEVHLVVLAAAAAVLLLAALEWRSSLFRRLYLAGENGATAVLHGIRVGRIKIAVYAASALMAGAAGLVGASRVTHADSKLGEGMEFTMVTAAVLGGASLFGGKGSLAGAFLGLLFLLIVRNGMVAFDIDPALQSLAVGVLLLLAVGLDRHLNGAAREVA
jgi:ribose/xylose/arabinose/galactoside ABC-type transport system permease subunit